LGFLVECRNVDSPGDRYGLAAGRPRADMQYLWYALLALAVVAVFLTTFE
jgi:hypothetical protein